MKGSHYETMLACGIPLKDVLALAVDVAEVQAIDEPAPDTEQGLAPTVVSPRGIAILPSPIQVVSVQ